MLSYLRNSSLITRLGFTALFTGFAAALAWRSGVDPLIVSLATLAVAATIEVLTFHRRAFLVFAVTLGQLMIASLFSLGIYSGVASVGASTVAYSTAVGVLVIAFTSTLVSLFIAYRFAWGKLVPNIIVSYLIYNAVFLGFAVALSSVVSIAVSALVAAVAGISYPLARTAFRPGKKRRAEQLEASYNLLSPARATASLAPGNCRVESPKLLSVLGRDALYLVGSVPGSTWSKENMAPLFHALVSEAKSLSHRVKSNRVVPVLLVAGGAVDSSSAISIYNSDSAHRLLGHVQIAPNLAAVEDRVSGNWRAWRTKQKQSVQRRLR